MHLERVQKFSQPSSEYLVIQEMCFFFGYSWSLSATLFLISQDADLRCPAHSPRQMSKVPGCQVTRIFSKGLLIPRDYGVLMVPKTMLNYFFKTFSKVKLYGIKN